MLIACLWSWAPGWAQAQQPDPLRILVLEGPSSEWVRRVRGQLSDLPVAISTLALVVEGQSEPELAQQFARLAEHRDAVLVAWLITERGEERASAAPAPGGTRVGIWFARSGRFFTRSLGAAWQRLSASDRSGVLEVGALTVRSAVRSLLLDPSEAEPFRELESSPGGAASESTGVVGAAPSGSASAASAGAAASPGAPVAPPASAENTAQAGARALENEGPASLPVPEPVQGSAANGTALLQDRPIVVTRERRAVTTDQPSAEAAATDAAALALDWNAELGVAGRLPGPPAYGGAALDAALHARNGAWGVLALGQLGLPVRAEVGPSQVQVLQHAFLLEGQYLRWNTGLWSFGPLLRAGLSLSRRETVSDDPGLAASDAKWTRSLRFGLGWVTELRWSEHFGATLRGVLHWDPVHPSYELRNTEEELIARSEPWAVQPSLELCGIWYW